MKLYPQMLYALFFCLFSSFVTVQPCKYAGSNMTYVKSELEEAIVKDELQLARFHIFKALGALDKSAKQITDCDCPEASEYIDEASVLLKDATKSASLSDIRMLLKQGIQNLEEGINILYDSEKHDKSIVSVKPQEGTEYMGSTINLERHGMTLLKQKIDSSLTKYRKSLQQVIRTVDCQDARAFATRIYEHCQQQLLRDGLSEGKKYYNLRTEEITWKALEQLGDCERKK